MYLVTLGFMLLIVFMFIITYLLNNRTKKPDIDINIDGCHGCYNIECNHNPAHQVKEEEE
ncbi:MAG: hypothetical protein LBT75_02325 [Bacilli bacterium]|jgi:hypothetical protein|nr:hypothetical protein [Bacilli bacterium]